MSLKLPYNKYPDARTGGYVYVAALAVNIALPQKNAPRSKRFEAIIDSGATMCQFQAGVGRAMGFQIEKGKKIETLGINGISITYMHEIALYLPGGIVNTFAGFSDELPVLGLLGMTGFFENFKVIFDPTAKCCELERIFHA